MNIKIGNIELQKLFDNLWEIPKSGGMLVPGRIYTNRDMIESTLRNDEAVKQVVNVAHLPGIQKYSLAMPDIHWGYGFPIGGVAATDLETGVISPGGVGYDINCGVRLASTSLSIGKVQKRIKMLTENLFKEIPTGVGAKGAIQKLKKKDLLKIAQQGSGWAIENGFGKEEDILTTEENGCLKGFNSETINERAIERGLDQAGTLGSGNHFLEVDVVDEIYDKDKAEIFGLFEGQIVIQIHTGSRGFGYQVCDDNLKILLNAENKFGYKLPDRQLACAPIKSEEGQNYLSAMKGAANFAWNNRQVIMHLANKVFKNVFSISEEELNFNLVYDVCHNIAKIEKHNIDGKMKKVCVHRKGATRAFPPGDKNIPVKYRVSGQPVLIPGDMGRYSFIAAGTDTAMEETFGSSCHGAGRVLSRSKALKAAKGKDLIMQMKSMGIEIQAKGLKTIAEEMPEAYKDVSNIVDIMHLAGITKKVAKLKPLGVIKG